MKPVWTRAAIRDLTNARKYIARENPDAAREIALKIVDASERVIQFPEVGRVGRASGTRELVVSGTPYLIVYRLKKNAVHFLRVLHGHQKWPK
ncbi:MAG TPA: type II toxin-antitoxin system RelE/ParE family toxin [Blastocatellia bacterium]